MGERNDHVSCGTNQARTLEAVTRRALIAAAHVVATTALSFTAR
jgi:hypothetical protein